MTQYGNFRRHGTIPRDSILQYAQESLYKKGSIPYEHLEECDGKMEGRMCALGHEMISPRHAKNNSLKKSADSYARFTVEFEIRAVPDKINHRKYC
jgi:hypothetical protein